MNPPILNITSLPKLLPNEIEKAVESFIKESGALVDGVDEKGLYEQMIRSIADIVLFKKAPHAQFWLAHENERVVAFCFSHWGYGVDGRLCLWLTDAWIAKEYRGIKRAKAYFHTFREFAKNSLCKHILVVSSRENKSYCRFLGKGWKPYFTVLKEDI